jgi:chemotaxis protein methyltransferase CheR
MIMVGATASIDLPTFDYIRQLVHQHAAIALEPNKGYLVESRLLPLARELGLATLADLVVQLRKTPFGKVHNQVVEAMTTNETSFFRDNHPFDVLRTEILPSLIQSRAATRSLSIWSAACSTGQEPYSIAMLLLEHFPQLKGWRIEIHATDLSQAVLDKAQRGEFTQLEVNRGLPAALLVKHFRRSGLHWQLSPEIRNLVRFQRLNLISQWPALPTMDIVFIRNVLIYFNLDSKRDILRKVGRQMAKDGTLFLGGAETTLGVDDAWQRVNHGKTSTYRLTAG